MTGTRSQEGLSMILNIEGTDENIGDVLVTHGLAHRSVLVYLCHTLHAG